MATRAGRAVSRPNAALSGRYLTMPDSAPAAPQWLHWSGQARRQIFQNEYQETEVMTVKKIKIRKLSKLEATKKVTNSGR
jgi:hypothetical protein